MGCQDAVGPAVPQPVMLNRELKNKHQAVSQGGY